LTYITRSWFLRSILTGPDRGTIWTTFLPELDEDVELASPVPDGARPGPREGRLDGSRDLGNSEVEVGSAGAVDVQVELGNPRLPGKPGVGHPRDIFDERLNLSGEA
jgi:hypothetical protein